MTLQRKYYIEISGAMGVGKTSLARAFNEVAGFTLAIEREDALERLPFVEEYLADPMRYGLEGNLNFFSFHWNNLTKAFHDIEKTNRDDSLVTDWSPSSQYAFGKTTLKEDELETIERLINHAYRRLPKNDLIIYPHLPHELHMARIAKRGRECDEGIPPAFVKTLSENLREAVYRFAGDTPVLEVDSSTLNWATNQNDKRKIVERALSMIS